MKLQLTPTFPGTVTAVAPLSASVANGAYTFSIDYGEPTVITADATIAAAVNAIAVNRNAPTLTQINLPTVVGRNRRPLFIVDWSQNVVNHEIRLTPLGAQTIMRGLTWSIFSNAAQLSSIALYPSESLNGWYTI